VIQTFLGENGTDSEKSLGETAVGPSTIGLSLISCAQAKRTDFAENRDFAAQKILNQFIPT